MKIHSESVIHHPLDRVYETYRDRLAEIADYIPDVKRIDVESREESEGVVKLHNVWYAEREIPRVVRSVLKPEMLQWDDYAEWHAEEYLCHWTLRTRVFTDDVSCGGTNTFVAVDEGSTRVTIAGDLSVELSNIPGVPRLLGRKLKPQVEKFIVNLITPNLEQVNGSLERFLDDLAD